MKKYNIKELISQSRYETAYLPIMSLKSEEIFAYEAQSQFKVNNEEISSHDFFSQLHGNEQLFYYLEKKNKAHQINNANIEKKLILNFDTVVFQKKEYRKFWKEYLGQYRDHIIISITHSQNLNVHELEAEKKLIKWLTKHNFEFMISAFFDELFTLSFANVEKANYLRIHKSVLHKCENNTSYTNLLKSIISFCQENNIKTLIKYIDEIHDLSLVKNFEPDFIQGKILVTMNNKERNVLEKVS